MVYGRQPSSRLPRMGSISSGMAPPKDLLVLLAVVFLTYSLRFFEATRVVPEMLELTPLVWRWGLIWQLVTYPVAAVQTGTLWFLLSLFLIFWFGRDVFYHLGRKRFWRTLVGASLVAAVVAVLVHAAATLLGFFIPNPFYLMQGQHILLTLMIAAFATVYGEATIYLFFILPVKAGWFLWIEVVFAFLAFLGSKDFAGFVGVCVAVGATWYLLQPKGRRPGWREFWLRGQKWWLEQRMKRLRKKRGFRVVPGEGSGGGGRGGGRGDYLN